jgi:hypothetical protein
MGDTTNIKKGDWKEKRKGREERRNKVNEFVVTSSYDKSKDNKLTQEGVVRDMRQKGQESEPLKVNPEIYYLKKKRELILYVQKNNIRCT